jgi:hypothetical protein
MRKQLVSAAPRCAEDNKRRSELIVFYQRLSTNYRPILWLSPPVFRARAGFFSVGSLEFACVWRHRGFLDVIACRCTLLFAGHSFPLSHFWSASYSGSRRLGNMVAMLGRSL